MNDRHADSADLDDTPGSAPPTLPERVVSRPRLLVPFDELADAACPLSVVVVVAPAGAGKTVLASQWVRGHGEPPEVRWLPASLHDDLVPALLNAAGRPNGAVLEVGRPDDEASEHARVVQMLRAATDTGQRRAVLVVDDAHLLAHRKVRLLARILGAAPEAVPMALLTRRDLPLPVVPLELAGRLQVIRAGQIQFREEEAKELVRSYVPRATSADLRVLQERTHGWAAALILGARALQVADDPEAARALLGSTDQPVLDYLLVEALDALPDETLRVLQVCSSEPELTSESVEALTGSAEAVDLLASLARDGLLVTAYPASHATVSSTELGGGVIWQLHPLLREYLRRRSPQSAEVEHEGHVRGVRHARAIGDPVAAVRHAVLSGDHDLVSEVVVDMGPDLVLGGNHDVLLSGVEAVPTELHHASPSISAVQALHCRAVGDVPGALRFADDARRSLRSGRGTLPDTEAQVDVVSLELWLARFGRCDARAAIRSAHVLLETLSTVSAVRACTLLVELAATEAWIDDIEGAHAHITDALVLARTARSPRLTSASLALQSVLTVIEGRAAAAAVLANDAIALREDVGGPDDVDSTRAHIALAWSSFHALDLASAQRHLDVVRQAVTAAYEPLTVMLALVLRARLLIEGGRVDDADRLLATPVAVPTPIPRFANALVSVTKAQLAAITGAEADVIKETQILHDLGCPDEATLHAAITLAHEGHVREAVDELTELMELPPANRVTRAATETIRLVLLLMAGRVQEAEAALPHMLTLIGHDRLLHVLTSAVRTEEPLCAMLYQEVQRPDCHPFAATALAALRSYRRAYRVRHRPGLGIDSDAPGDDQSPAASGLDGTDHAHPAAAALPVELTPRELAVIRQLALGGSYGDVASALYVTINTVKTHLASAYRKLGATRKAEALQVARDLGLVGAPAHHGGSRP